MDDIIRIASDEIGYVEKRGNDTKYGRWFGLNHTAWCGIFVSWVYSQAGCQLPKIGWTKGYAGCQYCYEWAVKNNKLTTEPSSGDIVLYDFNGDKRHDHTGIFVEWISQTKGTFTAIEGNTSLANQTNGGSVMERSRSKKHAVFVHI